MAKAKAKPYPPALLELMASKTAMLMKARTFADMGMAETAQPIWDGGGFLRGADRAAAGRSGPGPGGGGESHQRGVLLPEGRRPEPGREPVSGGLGGPAPPQHAGTSRRCSPAAWTN